MSAATQSAGSSLELAIQRRLVARARDDGDRAAFERLYRAFAGDLLVRVIRPRVVSDSDAEDVLVETFATALNRLETFSWQGKSFFHWLARIAANAAVDLGRQRQRQRRLEEALAVAGPQGVVAEPLPGDALLASATSVERAERIEIVMSGLNPRYVRALTLRTLEGARRQECADVMGVKLGTFDVVFLRAVRAFRKSWTDQFGEELI